MNKVFLSGNLTRDPEVRYTPSGKAYTKMGIAVQRRFKNADGQYDVDFFNMVAWEKTAEFCGRYLKKGSKVLVEGRIQTSNYEGKDGTKRTGFDIWIDNIEFASSKSSSSGGDYSKSESRTDEEDFSKHDDDNIGTPISDDNVPF